jgi:hypothetical protein
MGTGFKSQENPLLIPEHPQKIAFSKLLNYQIICQEFMHLIIRAYKAEDMYYES